MLSARHLIAILLAGVLLLLAGSFFTTAAQNPTPVPATSSPEAITPTPAPETPGEVVPLDLEGLTTEDWLSLGLAALIVLVFATLGGRLLHVLLHWLVKRTATTLDDAIVEAIRPQLAWFMAVVGLHFATLQLGFISDAARQLLDTVTFLLFVAFSTTITLRLVGAVSDWYLAHLPEDADVEAVETILPIGRGVAQVVIVVVAVSTILARVGIDLTAITASLGIAGLATSLAARSTIEDLIGGFFIIIDRPFRRGDRIDVGAVNTWGDVEEIGFRSCRIRTGDNRLVIVPNDTISRSQVVNYSYPDPHYRLQVELGIGYDNDIEMVRQLIVDTVRQVEGVLTDRPVDALFLQFGDSAMTFRVRWWIHSYTDARRMEDRVNTALCRVLTEAGVSMPYPTYDVNIKVAPEDTEQVARAIKGPS